MAKPKKQTPPSPTVTVTGTVSDICRHIASAHKLPALAEAASLVEWDDSEHTLTQSPLDKALAWLATTWPALTAATHSIPQEPLEEVDPKYARARESLAAFAQLMFGKRFRLRPVTRLMIKHLEEATRAIEGGRKARKIVNVPPQSGKTRLVSRLFVAWFMGRNPYLNVIVACHNSKLAGAIGDDVLTYIKSDDYRKTFPRVGLSDSSKSKTEFKLYVTDSEGTHIGGEFGAYGRGGGYTGHGAHLLVLDDLLKEKEVDSEAALSDVHRSIQALTSRLDPEGVSCVVVPNTRYRENDGCGYLLNEYASEGPWDVVVAPLIADASLSGVVGKTKTEDGEERDVVATIADHLFPPCLLLDGAVLPEEIWHRPDGDVLAPYSPDRAARLREKLMRTAKHEWWGQYQQSPVAATGNMVDPVNLRSYTISPVTLSRRSYFRVALSVDTGEGKKVDSARTAIGAYGEMIPACNPCEVCGGGDRRTMCSECKGSGLGHPVKMLELCAHPWQLPDQIAVVKAMAKRHRPDVILIEDKSTGFSLAQALRRDTDWPRCLIQLEGCDGDKIVRMSRASPVINDWQLALPTSAVLAGSSWQGVGADLKGTWPGDLRAELLQFPRGRFKDRCDQLSQYVNWRTLNPLALPRGVSSGEVAQGRGLGEQSQKVSRAISGGDFSAF